MGRNRSTNFGEYGERTGRSGATVEAVSDNLFCSAFGGYLYQVQSALIVDVHTVPDRRFVPFIELAFNGCDFEDRV